MTHLIPVSPSGRRWSLYTMIVLAIFVSRSDAADPVIQWRNDYNTARREATEKGKPLFIDFGTEECFHCKRLDSTTFRDPVIVNLLNQRFVPLKVDGNADPNLVQALRIQAYPTLIVASTDGKILSMIEGYMESGRLLDHLNRALNHTTPDWMARDFQEATKSFTAGDYAGTVTVLRRILEDGKDRPVQVKAKQLLNDIEQQASGRLARAKNMHDQGQSLEASDVLTDLLKRYAGTQAANDGATLLTNLSDTSVIRDGLRGRRAQELLALAREDFKAERYLQCLDHCEVLTGTYRDLPQGEEASQLASEVKNNPDRMTRVCELMNDRLVVMYMVQAEAWMKKGDNEQARVCLERAVKTSPGSPQSQTAQVRLTALQGKSTQQAEFQKMP